jgi:hypothetical protein
MRFLKRYIKAPGETLDYDVDFAPWLAARSDTIASFSVLVGTGAVVESSAQLGGKIRAYVSGGVSGRSYPLSVAIQTTGGRVKIATLQVRVRGANVPSAVPTRVLTNAAGQILTNASGQILQTASV